jgi:hypothetical protein
MLFLTHTLRPLLVNIEQEISRCLLNSDEDLFAEFSVEGFCAPIAQDVRRTIPAPCRMAGCRATMCEGWKICRQLKAVIFIQFSST